MAHIARELAQCDSATRRLSCVHAKIAPSFGRRLRTPRHPQVLLTCIAVHATLHKELERRTRRERCDRDVAKARGASVHEH
eukprot:6016019-Prymnesium_polylepis.2